MSQHAQPPRTTDRDVSRHEYAARCLAGGEQLYDVFSAGLDPLAPEDIPRRHRPRRAPGSGTEDRSFRGLRVLLLPFYWFAAAAALLTYPLEKMEDWFWGGFGIRRLVRGRVWQGGWESDAGRFVIAVRAGYGRGTFNNDSFLLTFTDRRVLLVSSSLSPERETPKVYGEYPRLVLSLRREPHPARHRNRVDVAFPDGSWVALAVGKHEVDDVKRYLAS